MLKFHLRPERGIGVGQTRESGKDASIRESSKFEDREKEHRASKEPSRESLACHLRERVARGEAGGEQGWLRAHLVCHI